MALTREEDLLLTDGHFFANGDPHALWTRLRAEDPVHWTASPVREGYWSVTRHADIQAVFGDAAVYGSRASGPSLPTDPELADPSKSEHKRLQNLGAMLPTLDPPRHPKARMPFVERFSPRKINQLEGRIRELAVRIIDRLPGERFDFVLDLAAWLPISVIFHIMDVPEEDWPMLFKYTNMHAAPTDPEYSIGTPIETRERGVRGSVGYCRELALKRRTAPGDDLLSQIATMRIDGELLSDDELGFLGHMFVLAGQETTRNSLSAGVLELIRKPDQVERLRANRNLIATAADEFFRWATPVQHLLRTAMRDTTLGGKSIREGDWVVCWMSSGNRDEAVFERAFEFNVARAPNPHVSFGYGPHFCLGAYLGRLQVRIMIELLLDRLDSVELAGLPEKSESIQFCGYKRLPVRAKFRPA